MLYEKPNLTQQNVFFPNNYDVNMCASQSLKTINKLSKIFQPINVIPKDAKVKKQDMMSNSQKVSKTEVYLLVNNPPFCS